MIIFPTTLDEIQALIDNEVQESLHLDYKEARAIGKSSKQKADFGKDVSAFANSDGGVLIYGIKEKGHLPIAITGVDHSQFTREFIEQTVRTNISHPTPNFTVVQIPINKKESVYSVKVEKSYGMPHQCKEDKKFYRRYNFESVPMESYEIEDIRNRRQIVPTLINIKPLKIPNRIFLLEVSNVGEHIAKDITFEFPEELKNWIEEARAFPFRDGMKILPPKEKIAFRYAFTYNIFGENPKYPSKFEISVKYEHLGLQQKQTEVFYIDLNSHLNSYIERNDVYVQSEKVESGIKELINEVKKLNNYLAKLAKISEPTGLGLSMSALRNLKSVIKDENFEKIDPTSQDYSVFREVLGIDWDLAANLEQFFWNGNQATGLKAVRGITDEIIYKIEKHFILEGEIS